MDPIHRDLIIWRGASFIAKYIAQNKVYTYDPPLLTPTIADNKRTHEENLEFYGFIYEYVDFIESYASAELVVIKPWVRDGQAIEPILSLTTSSNNITLTEIETIVTIVPTDTKNIMFDSGTYNLLLTKLDGQVDLLAYGTVTVRGGK
jgi:hypothetical protein